MNFDISARNSSHTNINNNYKYDGYGFLLVNSIDDLLYDKFNHYMENYIDSNPSKKLEKQKSKEMHYDINNLNSKYQTISTKRKIDYYLNFNGIKNKSNDKNKTMRIFIKKEKNEFKNKNDISKIKHNNSVIQNLMKNVDKKITIEHNKKDDNFYKEYFINNDKNNSKTDNLNIINKNNVLLKKANNKSTKNKINNSKNEEKNKINYFKIESNYNIQINNNKIKNKSNYNTYICNAKQQEFKKVNKRYFKEKQEEIIYGARPTPMQQRFSENNDTERRINNKYIQEQEFTFGEGENVGDKNINLNNNIIEENIEENLYTFNNSSRTNVSKIHQKIKKNYEKDDDISENYLIDKFNNKENNLEINIYNNKFIDNIRENNNDINKDINNGNERNYNNIENKKRIRFDKKHLINLPNLSVYYISKIRKNKNFNMKKHLIPTLKRIFITKSYSFLNTKQNKKNKNILILPKTTKCYFERKKEILMINRYIPLQTVIIDNFFITKEFIKYKIENEKIKENIEIKEYINLKENKIGKKVENGIEKEIFNVTNKENKNNNDSTNITIKLSNNKKSSTKNLKTNLKSNNSDINIHPINKNKKQNKIQISSISRRESKNDKKFQPKIKNIEIRKALNKTNKFKPFSNSQLYKDIYRKKQFMNGYKFSINNKFKNNVMNNYKNFDIAKNKSLNKIFPLSGKINDDRNRNKSISYINEQNNDNYLFFPAINSYFN